MSDDTENESRSLEEQLEDVEVEAREADDGETDGSTPAESDGDDGRDADEEHSPEQKFERALEELSDEDLRARKFDTGDPQGEQNEDDSAESAGTRERSESGPMADALDELDVETSSRDRAESGGAESEPAGGRRNDAPASLEDALEGMTESEMRERKFAEGNDGVGGASDEKERPTNARKRDEESDGTGGGPKRESALDEDERAKFERAMRDVDERERSSKYVSSSEPDPEAFFEDSTERTPRDFVTETLPKSGEGLNDIPQLDEAQEAMLERCERWEQSRDVPELNLRGERVSEAIDRLERFFEQSRAEGARFVRIIHGRGEQSEGAPTIKPTVLKWLERRAVDAIRGYVPERQFGGDYGSTVVEFRKSDEK